MLADYIVPLSIELVSLNPEEVGHGHVIQRIPTLMSFFDYITLTLYWKSH